MNREQILALIKEKRPALLEGKDVAALKDDELTGILRMAMEPEGQRSEVGSQRSDNAGTVTKEEFDLFRCGQILETTVAGSGLPTHAQNRMRSLFKSRVFTEEELNKAIADEKDYLARVAQSQDPGVTVAASELGSRLVVGIGTMEKAQIAVDKLFGLTQEELKGYARMETLDGRPFFNDRDPWGRAFARSAMDYDGFADVPAFRGIREAYVFFTGDTEITGFMNRRNLPPALRTAMDISSSTFNFVFGNTLNRRLVKEYREFDFLEALIISVRKAVRDFRTQEAILVGGYPDLSDVDPEAANYAEIAGVDDEEVSYTVGQKGNLLTITRKAIINDDISVIDRRVRNLGRSARRTHGKFAWGFLIDNGTCTDGTAMFTAGHANLGAAALTVATARIAYQAIANFTEKGSGERLGLLAGGIKPNLVGPNQLMDEIQTVTEQEFYYTANDLTTKTVNDMRGKLIGHVHPMLTDANDWYMLLPPEAVDIVEMGYLNGREEPEFFLADSPQAEQVFVADKIRHKVRHEYGGHGVDFRAGYKAVVA